MKSTNSIYTILYAFTFIISISTLHAQVSKMYVGTYTSESESKGVYVYDFDEKSGKAVLSKTISMSNPSFLARNKNMLYAVNEDVHGMVTVYDLEQDRIMSHASTKGAHPCHIALSPKDPIAIVSNYSSGSLCLYSLKDDGSLDKMDDFIEFKGSSIDSTRQNESHIHSAFFTNDGSQVYVSDLGADLIYVLQVDISGDNYKLRKVDEIKTKLGGGPRHLTFSKNENTLYSILELTGEIEVFVKTKSKWMSKQIIPMYPKNFDGQHGGADIKISKNGKYVYATNRGTANLLYKYKIKRSGRLKTSTFSSVFGDSPRNVNLSPQEKRILISNQSTNNITIIDNKFNLSKNNYIKIAIPKPVCVIF